MIDAARAQPTPVSQAVGDLAGLLLLALAVYAVVLLADKQLPSSDVVTHYHWLTQFHAALAEGTWYPRWMPQAQEGLGELNYSAYPLYQYVGAGLIAAGLDVWSAMRAMGVAGAFLGAAVIYLHSRKQWGRGVALASAALWELAPYPFFLFGYSSALPTQFSSFLALELIFLSLLPAPQQTRPLRIALVAAALTLAHVLASFMTLLCLGLVLLYRAMTRRTAIAPLVVRWALPAALGVGLTAFHFVPAVAAQALLKEPTPELLEYIYWKNAFMFPTFSTAMWGMRWFSAQWVMPSAGLFGVLACAAVLRRRTDALPREHDALAAFVMLGAAALVLGSELALPLYALPTPLRSLQWPFRFNLVLTFSVVLALPLAAALCRRGVGRDWRAWAVIAAMGVHVLLLVAVVAQVYVQGKSGQMTPALMQQRHVHQPGAELATIGAKWREYVQAGALANRCREASATCVEKLAMTQHRIWEVTLTAPQQIVFPLFAFPGWSVRVDQQSVTPSIDADTGLIALALPAGRHEVEIVLTGLTQARPGLIVSSLSLLGLALLELLGLLRRARGARTSLAAG